ncbi:MAG TPA: NAD(P)/FAD-dependent oxidoreductase [Dongiaceae bacterium]
MTESVEAVVIGAGAVGLAVARALAIAGREVLILEAAATFGSEISSRNSEVIHAGIYYPTGSLKARLCLSGREQLYAYCASHSIAHKRLGKLIVASEPAQIPALQKIKAQAEANGVGDLEWLGANAVQAMEPALQASAALLSPSTGIVDSHGLMLSYLGEAEAKGAAIAFHSPVTSGAIGDDGFHLTIGGATPMQLDCRYLVNAAGLDAQQVAQKLSGFDPALVPPLYLAKGNYFVLAGSAPFERLVYPVPEHGGLGVHLTLDLAGRARFGPDVEWVGGRDYRVEAERAAVFYGAIRRYWPGLEDGKLAPGYSGIRPKLSGAKDPAADFLIQGPASHRIPRLVNLFGIESPGLTSSLALADMVATELAD